MKNIIPSYKIKEDENIIFRLLKIEDIPKNYENKSQDERLFLQFNSKGKKIDCI